MRHIRRIQRIAATGKNIMHDQVGQELEMGIVIVNQVERKRKPSRSGR
jgi:hypothetical protein